MMLPIQASVKMNSTKRTEKENLQYASLFEIGFLLRRIVKIQL